MFDLRQFAALAPEWYQRLHYHDELGSTNDEAIALAEAGAGHGTVILADHQKAGRGRRGASWISGPGDGLLFSLILRPAFEQSKWSRIALATGLGIVAALRESVGVSAKVKWPNDIYIGNRKCAGILAEARGDFVVVGVGLNVMAAPDTPCGSIPTVSLSDVARSPVSREKVLAAVLERVIAEVESCGGDFGRQAAGLREVCYLTGKAIEFTAGENRLAGLVRGISDDGSLMIEVNGETRPYAQAAEIRTV